MIIRNVVAKIVNSIMTSQILKREGNYISCVMATWPLVLLSTSPQNTTAMEHIFVYYVLGKFLAPFPK
jgi:hypothetical protein